MKKILRHRDGKPMDYSPYHFCLLTERESIAVGKFAEQEAEAHALRDRLAKEPSKVINANGDRFMHAGDHILISLARTDSIPSFDMVGETNYRPVPNYLVRATATFAQCVRDVLILADKGH